MNSFQFLSFCLFAFGSGVLLFVRGFRDLKIKRQIDGLATSKIRSMAMGLVELAGIAEEMAPLVDPIYSSRCAFYEVVVKELRRSGKNAHWETIFRENSGACPFYLNDTTGRAIIFPKAIEVQIPSTIRYNGSDIFQTSLDPAVTSFLNRFRGFGRTLSLDAHIVRTGDPIYLLGYAQPPRSSIQTTTVTPQEVAFEIKSRPELMKALDVNQDGTIDSHEWDLGLKQVRGEMEEKTLKESLTKKPVNDPFSEFVSVQKSPEGLFILARDEGDITSRLGWGSVFKLFAGGLLIIGTTVLLVSQFLSL